MKKVLFAGLGLWVLACRCAAQTNCTTDEPLKFSLPPLHLRADLSLEAPAPAPPLVFPVGWISNPGAKEVKVSTADADVGLHTYAIRSDRFYLVEKPREPESVLVRGYNKIFEPEVLKIGKTTSVSCSVVTAVKRKNPLCLLNPIFFNMSW